MILKGKQNAVMVIMMTIIMMMMTLMTIIMTFQNYGVKRQGNKVSPHLCNREMQRLGEPGHSGRPRHARGQQPALPMWRPVGIFFKKTRCRRVRRRRCRRRRRRCRRHRASAAWRLCARAPAAYAGGGFADRGQHQALDVACWTGRRKNVTLSLKNKK